jgi:SAM-dependent methyltransferase
VILLWILGVILVTFLVVVFRGAPYVPSHRKAVHLALDMLDLPKGSTIIDLGSGDGVVLKLAAERGYNAIGYEINPILCAVSYVRCWKYREQVSVRLRDFWLAKLPDEADAVFVFLAGPYLRRLHKKLEKEHTRLLKVVSYGFLISEAGEPVRSEGALNLYEYK